jgi:hypothetical protein
LTPAIRLVFAYQGADVQLVDRQPVDQYVPPSDELDDLRGQSGFWYELRDANGAPLYRLSIGNPVAYETEIVTGDPANPIVRAPVPEPSGDFSLVVPVLEGAQSVALVSSPLNQEQDREPASDLLVVNLQGGGVG